MKIFLINDKFFFIHIGALVPNYNLFHPNTSRPEEAELELAVVYNSIDSIVNCGHSDCKV